MTDSTQVVPGTGEGRGEVGLDGGVAEALVRSRRFFTKGEVSADLRTLHHKGGRGADAFYRDRWSHDKVVRSTHGVNCTGSCSWKVYVKDGIITWETQQTDYPSVGPDRPEYEPRGCPRGAAFSWYTYSPTRIRYPYVRGVLLQMYREGKAQNGGDPVAGWAHVVDNPQRARHYKSARGKGGMVRATWDEATEMVAAAYVHTIEKWGPDRVAGFSPIPAMSMVSHASGARFTSLVGGSMLSFYDWYADLPVASPQVFGDQTDVPESGDWWDAGYLVMWGSNVPVTRTPDAHWMTEARYRGQKVVVVAPDYADNVKFADDWLAAAPGTDGALAMAMGHVILKEFFVDREVPYFADYTKKYTDLPNLVVLDEVEEGVYRPGKFLTAADIAIGRFEDNAEFKTVVMDGLSDEPVIPNGSLGHRFGDAGLGRWNLDLKGVDPKLTLGDTSGDSVLLQLPRFDTPDGSSSDMLRGVPVRRVGDHLVTTVFDLMLAQYGVQRPGLPGEWGSGYDDPSAPYTPAWQETITGVPAAGRGPHRAGVRAERRGVPGPLDDPHGRGHQPLVPLRHDLPRLPGADHAHRVPGRQRRRLGALRRAGEVPADHRLGPARLRARLGAAAAADDPDGVLVPAHRPVPLRPLRCRHAERAVRLAQRRSLRGQDGRRTSSRRAPGWAGCRRTRPSTGTRSTSPTRQRPQARPWRTTSSSS